MLPFVSAFIKLDVPEPSPARNTIPALLVPVLPIALLISTYEYDSILYAGAKLIVGVPSLKVSPSTYKSDVILQSPFTSNLY